MPHTSAEQSKRHAAASELLQAFVTDLAERYRARLAVWPAGRERISTLAIAGAALRASDADKGVFQLAVIGPTQVGKSTIVNELLGVEVAQASPLAGYTVHAHAFDTEGGNLERIRSLFPHRTVHTPDPTQRPAPNAATERERNDGGDAGSDAILYRQVADAQPFGSRGAVVWDTPDFDSVASGPYRDAALETLAIADVVVLVLSKEKYADMTVWSVLSTMAPLGRPLVVCLNKMTPDTEPAIRRSLLTRLDSQSIALDASRVISVPAFSDGAAATQQDTQAIELLRSTVAGLAGLSAGRAERSEGAANFIRSNWAAWVEPIVAEHGAAQDWRDKVTVAVAEAAETYEREFLEHPQRYDTFRRATAELLALLEVPGIGGALSSVRAIVTYPARRLLEVGRALFGGTQSAQSAAVHGEGSEQTVLFEIIDHLIAGAARDAARRLAAGGPAAPVWSALGDVLEDRAPQLRERLREAARQSCRDFEPEIQAAAGKLYAQLQTRPALLNGLRATRATTDLAGVALAVNSGGAALDDLLFAPAMFAVTSMLTEGALGSYMRTVAADLKARRKTEVNEKLFDSTFVTVLTDLLEDLSDGQLFSVTPEGLQKAGEAVDALGQGVGK